MASIWNFDGSFLLLSSSLDKMSVGGKFVKCHQSSNEEK